MNCAHRNPLTLAEVVSKVCGELTRTTSYGDKRFIYASHLASLGIELRDAFANESPLRPDVLSFAAKMTLVMNLKDKEKGPVAEDYELTKALVNMERQFRRLSEFPAPNADEMRRIFVHIANFAMIAERKLNG